MSLCWAGSLRGYAAEVMTACDLAVERDPDSGWYRDSRGVARALTGDYPGAISDFEAYIQGVGGIGGLKNTEDEDRRKFRDLESAASRLGGCVEEGRKSVYGGGVAGVVRGVIDWEVWEDGEVWEATIEGRGV
jgi:hypothetical protein